MDATLQLIVTQLIDRSKKGDVVWNNSDLPNAYYVSLQEGSILVHLYSVPKPQYEIDNRVECVIKNAQGDVILKGDAPVSSEDGKLMNSLYDAAFNAYTGKNQVIDAILNKLKYDLSIGLLDESPF